MTAPDATAAAAKAYWKVNHNQTARLTPREEQPHRWTLAEHIAALTPTPLRILEFGCSSGRNLAVLRQYLPDAHLVGVDMNPTTIQAGLNTHPTIHFFEGDERLLRDMRDGGFDVVFTCSVLDHIPHPEWQAVYDELVRIAGRHLVLLEPIKLRYIDELADGELVRTYHEADFANLGILAAPFSYAHDYLGYDPHLHIVRLLPIPAPMWPEFGATYHLMQRDKTHIEEIA